MGTVEGGREWKVPLSFRAALLMPPFWARWRGGPFWGRGLRGCWARWMVVSDTGEEGGCMAAWGGKEGGMYRREGVAGLDFLTAPWAMLGGN